MSPVPRRFTRSRPCPVCRGSDAVARGKGRRCFGYLDDTGRFARCTREEHAGALPRNSDGTYSHRLAGRCRCGSAHGGPTKSATAPQQSGPQRRAAASFGSFAALAAQLRRRQGEASTITPWIYRDGSGAERFRILRLDHGNIGGEGAKTYRPCHRADDGRWHLAKPRGPLPLYNLPAILAASLEAIIPVLEGEKCAEIAIALGLTHATTSAHGARAPQLTDWSPLAGRRIALIPDHGESGEEYANKVVAILGALAPPPRPAIIRLPGLADGEDIEQWLSIEQTAGLGPRHLLPRLFAIIEASCQGSRPTVEAGLQLRSTGVYPAEDGASYSSISPGTASPVVHNIEEIRMANDKAKPAHKLRSGAL